MTHRNILAMVSGVKFSVPTIGVKDVYLAYLPLAHILELAAEVELLLLKYQILEQTLNHIYG